MRLWLFSILTLVLASNQAVALSCLRPNLAREFNAAALSEEVYIIAKGRLKASQKIRDPNANKTGNAQRQIYSVSAILAGSFLGLDGFGKTQDIAVNVEISCLSVWCGQFPKTSNPMVMFLKKTPDGYALPVGPCPGGYKVDPSSRDISVLQTCLRNGKCSDKQILSLGGIR